MSSNRQDVSTRAGPAPRESASRAPELVVCPECGGTAELTWHRMCASTCGPINHAFVLCAAGHHFLMPAEGLVTEAAPTR